MRAIFGEKAADVKDTSLRLPPGVSGTVVEVRVFSRRGIDKDERALSNERSQIEQLYKDMEDEKSILESSFIKGLSDFIIGQTHVSGIEGLSKNKVIDKDSLSGLNLNKVRNINIKNDKLMKNHWDVNLIE